MIQFKCEKNKTIFDEDNFDVDAESMASGSSKPFKASLMKYFSISSLQEEILTKIIKLCS